MVDNPTMFRHGFGREQSVSVDGDRVFPPSRARQNLGWRFFGVSLALLVAASVALAAPAIRNTLRVTAVQSAFKGLFGQGLFKANDVQAETMLTSSGVSCCGKRGNTCLKGSSGSVCCATEFPIICGVGSTCSLNSKGHPYCCGPRTYGCSNVCVDAAHRSVILGSGGQCNGLAPEGFTISDATLFVDAPWDSSQRFYNFNGNSAMLSNPFFKFSTQNFTLHMTIFATNPSSTMNPSSTITRRTVLYSYLDSTSSIGFSVVLTQSAFAVGSEAVFRVFNGNQEQSVSTAGTVFFLRQRSTLRFIRAGLSLFIYSDNVQIAQNTSRALVDVDAEARLQVGSAELIGGLSGMRADTFANFP